MNYVNWFMGIYLKNGVNDYLITLFTQRSCSQCPAHKEFFLTNLALNLLCIPASSVYEGKCCLTDLNFENLMFLG